MMWLHICSNKGSDMKIILLFIICEGLIKVTRCVDAKDKPEVLTRQGLIQGLKATDGDYSMFLGIPFAKVDPKNPFGPSKPHPRFEHTFIANNDSAQCPQYQDDVDTVVGSLDCLQLNVYVPNIKKNPHQPLPVLVWIYGGSFTIGSAGRFFYGPKHLVKHDVILVTLNYRLGPYGFMCLNTPTVPGNQGLKDQLLGLKWVKANIGAFGGDSNGITIFGESSGAVSVDLHVLSPHEKLYNKIIMQSGSAQCHCSVIEPDLSAPQALARQMGHITNDTGDALSFLTNADSHSVIAATVALQKEFGPCVEKKFKGVEIFIEDYPINLKAAHKIAKMPILLGFNNDEMIFIHGGKDEVYFESLGDIFQDRLNLDFTFKDEKQLNYFTNIVRHFYVGDEPLTIASKQDLIDFDSDFTFIRPALDSIGKYMEQRSGNIYLYIFSYSGKLNFMKNILNVTEGGAAHADELGYLFDQSYNANVEITPADQLIIDRTTTLWTNFAKFGNPTPAVTDLLPVKWVPVTKNHMNYYNINTKIEIGRRPFKQRIAFWDLFYTANAQYREGAKRRTCS